MDLVFYDALTFTSRVFTGSAGTAGLRLAHGALDQIGTFKAAAGPRKVTFLLGLRSHRIVWYAGASGLLDSEGALTRI